MIGLIILFFLIFYIFISYKIVRLVIRKTEKKLYWILIVAFCILLPTWDVIIGKVYFNYLCKTKGGFKVYKTIHMDGFFDKKNFIVTKPSDEKLETIKLYLDLGLKFYEAPALQKLKPNIFHFIKDSNGNVEYKVINKPKSKYAYFGHSTAYTPVGKKITTFFHIKQTKQGIKDLKTGEIIIENIAYHRIGWIYLLFEKILGSTSPHYDKCETVDSKKFKQQVLKGKFNEQ